MSEIVRSPAEYLTTLLGYLRAGYSGGKNSEEVPVGTNHESIQIIRITQWLIVLKRNIFVWSIRSTPFSTKLTNSFMVSARDISNTYTTAINVRPSNAISYFLTNKIPIRCNLYNKGTNMATQSLNFMINLVISKC